MKLRSVRDLFADVLVIFAAAAGIAVAAADPRPLTIEDVLSVEPLPPSVESQSAFAPDGQAVVFSVVRSQARDPSGWTGVVPERRHSDLWFQQAAGLPALQITHGETDSSGWFDPQWSPDGHRLLMKSTRGGDLRYWIWERDTGSLKLAENLSVEGFPDLWRCHFAIWVDDNHILFCALPRGVRSQMIFPEVERLAEVGWAKAETGVESSHSILTSGRPEATSVGSGAQLLKLDVRTGQSSVLVEGGVRTFSLSKNLKYISVLKVDGVPRVEGIPAQQRWGEKDQLEVIDLEGRPLVASPATVSVPWLGGWSPSGEELAFWGLNQLPGRVTAPPTLYRANPRRATVVPVNTGLLDGAERIAPQWTAAGNIIVNAAIAVNADKRAIPGARADWYLVKSTSSPLSLTGGFTAPPPALEPSFDHRRFTASADGKIWTLVPESGSGEAKANSVVPMARNLGKAYSERGIPNSDLIVQGRDGNQTVWYALRAVSRSPFRLPAPTAQAKLVSYSTISGSALFVEDSGRGTFLWRTQNKSNAPELLKSSNAWLKDIAPAEFKRLEYTSLNGEKLLAWMILPVGYQSSRRYPLVTWVYSGHIAKEDASGMSVADGYGGRILQLWASHGYAVLVPSMPRKAGVIFGGGDVPDDELLGLTNGVLPAVDAAIAANVADPDRLFVAGHSFGGYSTYGLVTQTGRFKAAIALAGFTDLVSDWGAMEGDTRYSDFFDAMQNMAFVENAQAAMINPPWKDLGRYIRNSPISYVGEVQTPTLMIHGDIDEVPLSQAEEFFASLYRQGKAAQLVRYWGENHLIQSPANYRDMWARMLSWFDEYGDIAREDNGAMVFNGARVQSRRVGASPMRPDSPR